MGGWGVCGGWVGGLVGEGVTVETVASVVSTERGDL